MDDELQEGLLSGFRKTRSPWSWPRLRRVAFAIVLLFVSIFLFIFVFVPRPTRTDDTTLPVPETDQLNWAQYAPYLPAAQYEPPPAGCRVTQVNIIQRHGARFPTTGASQRILSALHKIQAVPAYTSPLLRFLESYEYGLGTDDLVAYGAAESFDAGREAFTRYEALVDDHRLPFIRSDSSQRDVDSATNWTAGFAAASGGAYHPVLALVLDTATGNNTLDNSQCPAAGTSSSETHTWQSIYLPPITAHLNRAAPGAHLTDEDTYNLISICPFETIATGMKSAWCALFERFRGAFSGFAYNGDLDKFYKTGYGQPLGAVQGVGYTNELLARLTSSPVQDHTQTDHTLPFPLDRTLYLDFSHDNHMVSVFAAMGLFAQGTPLDPRGPEGRMGRRGRMGEGRRGKRGKGRRGEGRRGEGGTWKVGEMVPFAGRMVVERLSCLTPRPTGLAPAPAPAPAAGPGPRPAGPAAGHAGNTNIDMVRVLVQDAVQPLEFCAGAAANEQGTGTGNEMGTGMCTLDAFVESQRYARGDGEGDWERCFEV
ncbi:phosphoglycerate mutase-like protein [Trametopsis cervina]|nr:phosphoglycerate mutase-like protein [Trametopsis cervina]